jgi:hypothetical protein
MFVVFLLVVIKAESKKNPINLFEAMHHKLTDIDGVADIDAPGRVASIRTPVSWLEKTAKTVLGWRQSASLPEMSAEVNNWAYKFKEAKRLLAQDQGPNICLIRSCATLSPLC